jgi:uncharacterized protein (DUF1800 family)
MLENRMLEAAHLLRRTGFGPTLIEIQRMASLTHAEAVAKLLDFKPQETALQYDLVKLLKARQDVKEADWGQDELQQAWLELMLTTPYGLQEKMALFWHNHFTSSIYKIDNPPLMLAQNLYFRQHGLDNFRAMAQAMAQDHAMLLYLDGVDNSKDNPNENFARELMELFTLGIGNYTEQDVREAARAFTGWEIDYDHSSDQQTIVVYNADSHDDDPKTFMGQTGNFDGAAIVNIILGKRQAAYFITRKLWEYFVYPNPTNSIIQTLGDAFFESDYAIRPLVQAILLHPEFLSAQAYRAAIKSPVELVVGTMRMLGGQQLDGSYLSGMGQELFAPPNVRGWVGGRHWLNSATFLNRVSFASDLISADSSDPQHYLAGLAAFANSKTAPSVNTLNQLATLLVDNSALALPDFAKFLNATWQSDITDLEGRQQEYSARVRGLAHLLICCPEFQLN